VTSSCPAALLELAKKVSCRLFLRLRSHGEQAFFFLLSRCQKICATLLLYFYASSVVEHNKITTPDPCTFSFSVFCTIMQTKFWRQYSNTVFIECGDALLQNVLGFACLAIYYCSFYFDRSVREQYR